MRTCCCLCAGCYAEPSKVTSVKRSWWEDGTGRENSRKPPLLRSPDSKGASHLMKLTRAVRGAERKAPPASRLRYSRPIGGDGYSCAASFASTNTVCTPLLCHSISLFAVTLQKSLVLVRLSPRKTGSRHAASRSLVATTEDQSTSQPINERPNSLAAAAVVPPPKNGSTTKAPGLVKRSM